MEENSVVTLRAFCHTPSRKWCLSKCSQIANSKTRCPSTLFPWEVTDFFLVMLPLFQPFLETQGSSEPASESQSHSCTVKSYLFNTWSGTRPFPSLVLDLRAQRQPGNVASPRSIPTHIYFACFRPMEVLDSVDVQSEQGLFCKTGMVEVCILLAS